MSDRPHYRKWIEWCICCCTITLQFTVGHKTCQIARSLLGKCESSLWKHKSGKPYSKVILKYSIHVQIFLLVISPLHYVCMHHPYKLYSCAQSFYQWFVLCHWCENVSSCHGLFARQCSTFMLKYHSWLITQEIEWYGNASVTVIVHVCRFTFRSGTKDN